MTLKEYLSKIHDDKEKRAALKAAAEEGREKEFLAAEGVELPEQATASGELSDDELSGVAGGYQHYATVKVIECRKDSRGNATQWKELDTLDHKYKVYHFECERCGRVLHKGTCGVYYCDPCDDWYWSPDIVIDVQGYY